MRVKWDFILILALASKSQSPTEGCGVIPVEGHSMCTDPDPGGPTLIAPSLHWDFVLQPPWSTALHDTTDTLLQGLLRSNSIQDSRMLLSSHMSTSCC